MLLFIALSPEHGTRRGCSVAELALPLKPMGFFFLISPHLRGCQLPDPNTAFTHRPVLSNIYYFFSLIFGHSSSYVFILVYR